MVISKKIWPEYIEKIKSGEKMFEVRLADFVCASGDILLLEEWDPKMQQYTGRKLEKTVTYVLRTKDLTFWPAEQVTKFGLQVISF